MSDLAEAERFFNRIFNIIIVLLVVCALIILVYVGANIKLPVDPLYDENQTTTQTTQRN